MEPRHEEKTDKRPRAETKEARPRRFRIVKLEERIAPGNGHGNGSAYTCPNNQASCHKSWCGCGY
jgi:hypothetical protein